MPTHKEGKHGRPVGLKEPQAIRLGNAQAWCYLCGSPHAFIEPCLLPAESRARKREERLRDIV
jgi:hypothetical protein